MTILEFADKFDQGEWTPLHYEWLDRLAPELTRNAFLAMAERAQQLAFALELPPDMMASALPEEEPPSVFRTRDVMAAALRKLGIDPENLPAEEGLLILHR